MTILTTTTYKQEWKEFLSVVDEAEKQSPGVRAKIACCLYDSDSRDLAYLLPPEFISIEDFGYNHILGLDPSVPLEYCKTSMGSIIEFKTIAEAEKVNEQIKLDIIKSAELVTKPEITHAEIHAMMISYRDCDTSTNAMFVSQTPCCKCDKVVEDYMLIEHLTVRKFFRTLDTFIEYIRNTKALKTFSFVQEDGTLHTVKISKLKGGQARETNVQDILKIKELYDGV